MEEKKQVFIQPQLLPKQWITLRNIMPKICVQSSIWSCWIFLWLACILKWLKRFCPIIMDKENENDKQKGTDEKN